MHLAQGLSTTRTSRRKQKPLTQKELQDYTVRWREHNKDLRRRYLHSMQYDKLDDFISYCMGQKYIPQKNIVPKVKNTAHRKDNAHIPSHEICVKGGLAKPETKVYTGERKLVGIATMHKSNMVPVFEDESGSARKEASELASMRR